MKNKPYCLSPNSVHEWGLLPISIRNTVSIAMKELQDAQGVLVKNSVFVELPQKVQSDVVEKRSKMSTGKNAVSVDACSLLVLMPNGKVNPRHEIFTQALAKAAVDSSKRYGAVLVDDQVCSTVEARGHMKNLLEKVKLEFPLPAAPNPPATPPAGDNTPPAGDNTPPAGDNTPPAGDGANTESGNKKSNKKS